MIHRCARGCPLSPSARPEGGLAQARRSLPAGGGTRRAGPGGAAQPVKAARARGWTPTPATMARPSLLLPLGLALLALCLLALPRDARARPGDREVGERQDLSPNDPQVRKATQAAMASYNMGSNSIYYFRDTTILRAQSQVRPAGGAGRGRAVGGERDPTRAADGGGDTRVISMAF